MAIPMTCPGCQAAFEVPESLAGKTIRCTSCKTQLTVPAAAATATEAKKPFGWASSPAAAKPAATPLSLNDDAPSASVAKPAAAKPATEANGKSTPAKAAAMPTKAAVVVVDDDDEDGGKKTSPNKPSSKSGPVVKGAPKKRRVDDDDDDDDDDDRPRRKKKNAGGGGAMIALVGGGVLCLGAIVGLSVWLLSGDDKKDSAKTDSSSTSGDTTPAAGAQPVGAGGISRPGGATGTGMGMPPGGGADGTMPPGGGEDGMTMPPGGGAVVTMPPGGMSTYPPPIGSSGYPPPTGSTGYPPPTGASGFPGGMGMGMGMPPAGMMPPGGTPSPPIGANGFLPPPGMDVPPGGMPQPGGFPQSGGFPPPAGGMPQPGGYPQPSGGQFDPNQPPAGASIDGNLKADVGPFFTGVFDPQAKELITFSAAASRTNVITTRLNRFDVAKKFGVAGTFKVPHFVTRAAIDPTKGLLFVATVTRPSVASLGGQMLDQAAGVGDVQIFDLKQIREGKVKDGGDFRPLHTISVGRTIRGLELSNDGKMLYVASTFTSGKTHKSFLTVYDVETHKPAQPQKELSEPAWNMCKSPDGKTLLIIDQVESGKVASMLRLYDAANLTEVKRINLQGGGLDAAAATGGQFAAVVVANGQSKVVFAGDSDPITHDLEFGPGWKAAAKPGYVEFSPDGKLLFVSGHPGASGSYPRPGQQPTPAGLDVYEVTDANSPSGVKKKASIRTANRQMVGGHFLVSPDGEYLVFHNGPVVEAANVGGNNGEGAAIGGGGFGFPGSGAPAPGPGAFAPGGMMPPGGTGTPYTPPSTMPPGASGTGMPPSATGTPYTPPGTMPPGMSGMGMPPGGMGSPPAGMNPMGQKPPQKRSQTSSPGMKPPVP